MINDPQQRPPFYLITGFVIGLVLGLVVAWIIFPPRITDVGPTNLKESYKNQYRLMTSLAFASSGDLGRAQARLALLGDGDPIRALTTQAQVLLANNATQREARALAALATAMQSLLVNQSATAEAINTPNPEDQGQVSTPFEAASSSTIYELDSQELICDSADKPPFLQIFIFDPNANPKAGVQLALESEEGVIELATGSRPEMSPGYAEFLLSPRVVYTLSMSGDEVMGGIQAAACKTAAGDPAWGTWLVLFNEAE